MFIQGLLLKRLDDNKKETFIVIAPWQKNKEIASSFQRALILV